MIEKNINNTNILEQNKNSWDAMADSWFGSTALPCYGCLVPSEEELQLFPALTGKKVLDIGCGSGHSLKWCKEHGAEEIWGLDTIRCPAGSMPWPFSLFHYAEIPNLKSTDRITHIPAWKEYSLADQ